MFDMERWNLLPDEIILMIFKYLEDPELVNASMACKQWRRVYYDPSLWRSRTFEFRGYCKSHAERLQLFVDVDVSVETAAWTTDISPTVSESTGNLQKTLIKYVETMGIYLQHIRLVCPSPNLLTAYNVARCVETLLSGLSCIQYGRSNIQSFEICHLSFEHTWSFFRSSKWLLVDSIASFLELQTEVKMLSLHHAFLPPPFAYRIMKSFERSNSVMTLEILDVLNYYSSEVSTNLIGKQLQSVCNVCWRLQEIRLNYSYLSSAKVVDICECLSESLKNLIIYVTPFDYSRGWNIINSDSWKLALQVCPRLQVYFHFEGWPRDALVLLVPYIPLVELTSKGTQCRYSTLTLGDKTSLLLDHMAKWFSSTVQAATFLTDSSAFTSPSRDSLVHFLTKCQHVKSLVFSKQLMSQEIINQARSELPNNSCKDVSVTLMNYVDTMGIYLQHIRLVCPSPNLLTAYNVARCVETLLSGLSCLQYGRSTIQSFEMCQLFFEDTWSFFRSSKSLLVDNIASFLELQTQLKILSLHHAFLPPPFAYRIMKSFARSNSVKTLEVLDVLNYYSIEVSTNLIGRQLKSVFTGCLRLQEIRLNYSYLSSAKVVDICEYLSESLKNLIIYVTPFDYSRGWNIIHSDNWMDALHACPRLQVYFHFEGWPRDALVLLVPYMPLVELTSKGTQCRYSTLTLGDKTSLLLDHMAKWFSATVQAATFLTDSSAFTSPSRDSLVHFLTKCQHIKSLVFSKQLMTQEIINQARSELPNNSCKDLSVVKIV